MKAYEECLTATSTGRAPWYVVPADDKENARLIVSQIVLDTFEGLKMAFPETSAKRRRELLSIRKQGYSRAPSARKAGPPRCATTTTTPNPSHGDSHDRG